MNKEPFRMYSSEEEIKEKKKKTWTITVRVNSKEQEMINEIKKALNLHMDGTALKIGAKVGLNVLHGVLGKDILTYLSDPTRRRELFG